MKELGTYWRLLHPVGYNGRAPPEMPADAPILVLIAQYEALGNRSLRERVRLALLVRDRVGNEQRECETPFFTCESPRRSGRCAARGTGVS